MLLLGVPLMIHLAPQVARIDGGWRVLVTLTTPDHWVAHLGTFIPGVALVVAGIVLFFVYQHDPGPGRWLTALDYPLFTLAGWLFGITAVLGIWRTSGHVADVGSTGVDWRFLAFLRSQPLDYVVIGVALAACVACIVASWGFVSGRWATPTDPRQRQQQSDA